MYCVSKERVLLRAETLSLSSAACPGPWSAVVVALSLGRLGARNGARTDPYAGVQSLVQLHGGELREGQRGARR